jgi:hypothetical protein
MIVSARGLAQMAALGLAQPERYVQISPDAREGNKNKGWRVRDKICRAAQPGSHGATGC